MNIRCRQTSAAADCAAAGLIASVLGILPHVMAHKCNRSGAVGNPWLDQPAGATPQFLAAPAQLPSKPPLAPGFFSKLRGAQIGVHYAVNDCECQRSDQGSRRWFCYRVLVHSACLDLSRSVRLPSWPAGDVARFDLMARTVLVVPRLPRTAP